jgi:hypothetical protein
MWKPLPFLGLTLLTGCLQGTPKPSPLVGCVANTPVSAADLADAGRELNRLPEDSVIANTVVPDWIRMRDANKRCAQ